MQKEIFDLLVDISNKGYIDIERQGNFINRDIVIEENKIRNSLNYLLSQGLISNSSNNIFIITEFGYEVSRYSSWIDYITKQKEIRDRKTRKENIDLKISEFQVRTKFLPYYISAISILISLVALTDPFKWGLGENKHRKIEPLIQNRQLDTVSHTNKDRLDTADYNHTILK